MVDKCNKLTYSYIKAIKNKELVMSNLSSITLLGIKKNLGDFMSQRIQRSSKEPRRVGLSWGERWKGEDKGLINCWEVGCDLRVKEPDLALRAQNGELPVLVWKGGVEKKTKKGQKFGTLYYLAQWQGLRGDDLDINLSQEPEVICSRTGVLVIYTSDLKKYGNA